MTDNEIVVTVTEHGQQIKSLNRRMDAQEKKSEVLTELAMSVQKLALGMETMNEKQDSMSARLEAIESKPAQAWNTLTRTALTAIVSAVAGGLAVLIVQGLAKIM